MDKSLRSRLLHPPYAALDLVALYWIFLGVMTVRLDHSVAQLLGVCYIVIGLGVWIRSKIARGLGIALASLALVSATLRLIQGQTGVSLRMAFIWGLSLWVFWRWAELPTRRQQKLLASMGTGTRQIAFLFFIVAVDWLLNGTQTETLIVGGILAITGCGLWRRSNWAAVIGTAVSLYIIGACGCRWAILGFSNARLLLIVSFSYACWTLWREQLVMLRSCRREDREEERITVNTRDGTVEVPHAGVVHLPKDCDSLLDDLEAQALMADNCEKLRTLPQRLSVRRLSLNGCIALKELPDGIACYQLSLRNTRLQRLPEDLQVDYQIDLQDNVELTTLPAGLKTGSLILRGCTALKALPEGLDVCFLDISGCTQLERFPEQGRIRHGRLRARGCTRLTRLPDWLDDLAQLDVSGCTGLQALPDGLRVHSWIDLAGTAIREVPGGCTGARLRWNGVWIDERIAFRPETITVSEILSATNVELRRVLLARYGFDRFMRDAEAEQLDRDADPGGERRLLRVKLDGDEDLVCISMFCPSTGRQYITRVPPTMETCRQAVAWMAGYDHPDRYRPLVET